MDPEDARALRNYLYQMQEQLQYVLSNLDTENMSGGAAHKLQAFKERRIHEQKKKKQLLQDVRRQPAAQQQHRQQPPDVEKALANGSYRPARR